MTSTCSRSRRQARNPLRLLMPRNRAVRFRMLRRERHDRSIPDDYRKRILSPSRKRRTSKSSLEEPWCFNPVATRGRGGFAHSCA